MLTYTITEAKAKLAEVYEKVLSGEEVIVTKQGKPPIKISPYLPITKSGKRIGFLKGRLRMADDFDKWPDDIARSLGIID